MLAYFSLSSPFKIAAPSPIRQLALFSLILWMKPRFQRQTFMDSRLDSETKASASCLTFMKRQ